MAISPECNFIFLEDKFPFLAKNACIAESCLYDDPHNSIIKIGIVNEKICRLICEKCKIEITKKDNFAKVVHKLKKYFFTEEDAETCIKIDTIVKSRNIAAHNLPGDEETYYKYREMAINVLYAGYLISANFYLNFIDSGYKFKNFHLPEAPLEEGSAHAESDIERLLKTESFLGWNGANSGRAAASAVSPDLSAGMFGMSAALTIGGSICAATGVFGQMFGGKHTEKNKISGTIQPVANIFPEAINEYFCSLDEKKLD